MTTAATLANPFHAQRFAAARAAAPASSANNSAAKLAATAESFAAALTRVKAATTPSTQSAASSTQSAPATHSDVLSQSRSLLDMIQQAQSGTQTGTVTGNTDTNTTTNTDTSVDTTGFAFPQLPQPTATAIQTGNLPWLKAPTYLVAASALPEGSEAVASRPSVKEFMDKTGVDVTTASSVLYSVAGANRDLRDWSAIMASADPLSSARASAAAQYNTTTATTAIAPAADRVLARSGNFAVLKDETGSSSGILSLVDHEGKLLRQLPDNPATILAAARDYGFDVRDLAGIATQLDAAGIENTNKVDYAALANGGLGTEYDWREDALASRKGVHGQETLAANRAVATAYGYA